MREPVLQDKRQEHVKFQKYGLELMEQVSGRVKSNVNEFELSLAKIHKADVVSACIFSLENEISSYSCLGRTNAHPVQRETVASVDPSTPAEQESNRIGLCANERSWTASSASKASKLKFPVV